MHGKCHLMEKIKEDQPRKQSAADIEKLYREKNTRKKRKEGTSKPSPKNYVLQIRQLEQVEQQVTPPIQTLILTYHNVVKQAVAKRDIFEGVSVGEKVRLRLKARNFKESEVKWKRLK